MVSEKAPTVDVLVKYGKEIAAEWLAELRAAGSERDARISDQELQAQTQQFLRLLGEGAAHDGSDTSGPGWQPMRSFLEQVSRARAMQGFTADETATFVFSLKRPLFGRLQRECGGDAERLARETWRVTQLVDRLGMHTIRVYQQAREEVIRRQQEDILELSTPVVKLWDGVLALPMIGTLDSARTQVVMESLLQRIVDTGSEIAIVDITGVPTVDTLVAQHLLKTVAAIRMMGAECIISGVRPQIAQTIVHLGISLENVTTKATLADALALALKRSGFVVSRPAKT